MNYKEQLYKNALEAIGLIYEKSKYDSNVDLYRSFDIINSVNDNQIASKEWLVKEILPFVDPNGKDICVLGGWYGLTALMLSQHLRNVKIDTVDSDPLCEQIGYGLSRDCKNIRFTTDSAEDWFFERPKKYQMIINTSCEHMEKEDVALMNSLKPAETVVCLQSNNYHDVQSHINTYDSLEEFVISLNLSEILYKKTLPSADNNYERYMVIGK